jgi:hypothetical protein
VSKFGARAIRPMDSNLFIGGSMKNDNNRDSAVIVSTSLAGTSLNHARRLDYTASTSNDNVNLDEYFTVDIIELNHY